MSINSYFLRHVIHDMDCNKIHTENKELINKIKIVEEKNSILTNEKNNLQYKLNGIMGSQDEIYKNYTELIIKISKCKC